LCFEQINDDDELCSGNHRVTEEEGDHGVRGEEIWSQKWEQQDLSTAVGRWRRRLQIGLDGEMWPMLHWK